MRRKVINADVIITMDDEYNVFSPGYIIIENEKIVEVGKGRKEYSIVDEVIEMPRRLIMPGLINSHTHVPMILTRGMCEGVSLFTMDGFLNTLRRYESFLDEDLSAKTMSASMYEMIRTGTTCFADQYFYADKIFNATDKAGLRGVLCYGIVELGKEEARKRETKKCEKFLEQCKSHPLINGWVGPHAFFVDNSLDLIKIELEMVKKYNAGFHIHFATSNEENDWCKHHYNSTAIQKMKELGILDIPIIAAHSITVEDADMEIMKNYHISPIMCPSSSMKSGFPAAPVKKYLSNKINVAIGTDNVCSSNSYDMFIEMATAIKLIIHSEGDVKAITVRDVIEMATKNGAKALNRNDIGSLEKGKKADLISLDLDDPGWAPFFGQDYYTQIVYSISGLSVTDSMVNGNFIMRDRVVLTVDRISAYKDLEDANIELIRRMK